MCNKLWPPLWNELGPSPLCEEALTPSVIPCGDKPLARLLGLHEVVNVGP